MKTPKQALLYVAYQRALVILSRNTTIKIIYRRKLSTAEVMLKWRTTKANIPFGTVTMDMTIALLNVLWTLIVLAISRLTRDRI